VRGTHDSCACAVRECARPEARGPSHSRERPSVHAPKECMRAGHARGSQYSCNHKGLFPFPLFAVSHPRDPWPTARADRRRSADASRRGGASRGLRRGHAGDVRPPVRGQGARTRTWTWTWTWTGGSGCGVRPGARERASRARGRRGPPKPAAVAAGGSRVRPCSGVGAPALERAADGTALFLGRRFRARCHGGPRRGGRRGQGRGGRRRRRRGRGGGDGRRRGRGGGDGRRPGPLL